MSLLKDRLLLYTDLVNQHSGMTEKYGPEKVKKAYLRTSAIRKRLIFALTACVLVANLLIIFSPSDKKSQLIDIMETLSAGVATAFCLTVVYRQKTDGLVGRAFSVLAAGLTLSLVAELITSFYGIRFSNENQFLSVPFALWLLGYGPIFYFVLKMYNFFGASHSKSHQLLLCSIGAAFLSYFIILIAETAEFTSQTSITSYMISIAYPVLDVVLLVPSGLILLNPVKGELTSIPWIFLAVLIMGVGDSVLAYT